MNIGGIGYRIQEEKIPSSQQSMSLTGNVLLFYLSRIHLGHVCICHYRARKSGSKRAMKKRGGGWYLTQLHHLTSGEWEHVGNVKVIYIDTL